MNKNVYKFKIPSSKDYYSMDLEERSLTAQIYNFHKNSLFIVLTKLKNNHYICAVCSYRKRNNCIKDGVLWINYKFLVKISGTCLKKSFVTNLNMNRITKKISSSYKGINRFPNNNKCKSARTHANNNKIRKKSKNQKNVQKSSKQDGAKKNNNFKMKKAKKMPPQNNQIQCLIPMSVPAKHQKYTLNSWYISHPISAGRGNF